MIIKRWNGSAFVKEFPETKAQLIRNNDDTENIFDGFDKIKLNYLPDAVFDSLYFYDVLSMNRTLAELAEDVFESFPSGGSGRSKMGVYFVANAARTITPSLSAVLIDGEYFTGVFKPSEEGDDANEQAMVLETGDWIVLTGVSGAGTESSPYLTYWAVVNNTYELAGTSTPGIVTLSSRTTYASLSGNNVVGENTLKTVIDNAAFASGTHVHGNITNAGAIGTTATLPIITGASGVLTAGAFGTTAGTFAQGNDARLSDARTPTSHTHGNITNVGAIGSTANLPIITTTSGVLVAGSFGTTANTFTQGNDSRLSDARTPTSHVHGNISNGGVITTNTAASSGQHLVVTSTSDLIQQSAITIGTATTTFLRNDGTWATPVDTNTTYAEATTTTLGLVELAFPKLASSPAVTETTSGSRYYGVSLNSNSQLVVNVPWTDTDTVATVTALGGLSATSNAFRMVHPFFVQADAPATPLNGTIWFDI
jgi:hypothetical protein